MTEAQEEQKDSRQPAKPSRHAHFMRGVITPIFGLLAVACIVFGILNSTIWKPSTHVDAGAQLKDTQYVLVDPGVLNLVDQTVELTASTTDTPTDEPSGDTDNTDSQNQTQTTDEVCIAIASAKDVAGWLSGEPYTRITGLSDWQHLSTQTEIAHGEASTSENQVAFKDSDMWQRVECSASTATIQLNDVTANQVALIDFNRSVSSADIQLQWTRTTVPDFAMPWYFAGGLLAILAVLSASIFAMDQHKRRKVVDETVEITPKERNTDETPIGVALAGSLSKLKPKKKTPSDKPHRRHARHGQGETTGSIPTVIDPHARNLVAEQEASADADHEANDQEPTSVISDDEFAAYFMRLAQEEHIETPSEPAADSSKESAEESTESTQEESAESAAEDSADEKE